MRQRNNPVILVPCLKLSPTCITQFVQYEGLNKKSKSVEQRRWEREAKERQADFLATLDNSTMGIISTKAGKRLKTAITWLVSSASNKLAKDRETGKTFYFKVNFITLTLPASQGDYTDNEIKSTLLNHWLIHAKRKYNLNNYVWKAEKQANGSIHFHITSDTYIFHYDLRKDWNKIIQKLGFVDRYRKAQQAWHKDGFKLRKALLKNWPEDKQRKAYNEGKRTNWSNPNSTDVKSVKNIRDLSAYLCKYMSKTETELINYKKRKIAAEKEGAEFTEVPPLQVTGRLWGCSQALSTISKQYLWGCAPTAEAINSIFANPEIKVKNLDFASIALIKDSDYKNKIHVELSQYYERLKWWLNNGVETGYNINNDNWLNEKAA